MNPEGKHTPKTGSNLNEKLNRAIEQSRQTRPQQTVHSTLPRGFG